MCATRVSKALPPTPPGDSPARQHFQFRRLRSGSQDNEDPEDQPLFRRIISRSNSVLSRSNSVKTNKSLPPSPPPRPKQRPLSELERKRSVHTSRPPQTQWNQGTILARANSVASSRPSLDNMADNVTRRRGSSLAERYPGDRSHRPLDVLTQEHRAKEADLDAPLPRRGGSLRQRHPGDMSHRPLDVIKREHRAADHAPHLRNHRRQQPSDPIDLLDHTGPLPGIGYHHEGPFDPTMKSKNTNKMYSPVEAVKDTNIEVLKATPAEFLKDSLDKHVPLQGTAVVPPGMKDMGGRTMDYEEGADLMREADAPGGAYKRWDHIPYNDDDLKGKGEPSFTIERDSNKDKQVSRKPVPASLNGQEYEMNSTHVHQRNLSRNTDEAPPPPPKDYPSAYSANYSNGNLQRNNSTGKSLTGKSLAQLIKRRFGSLRRRKGERVY